MKLAELIKDKDYDNISFYARVPQLPPDDPLFIGVCKSINGELISLDGDSYSDQVEVLDYEEWNNPERNVRHGLSVVVR